MKGPPLGPGGEDITWPNQVAPRGRKASSTRKIKPQTSDLAAEADPCAGPSMAEAEAGLWGVARPCGARVVHTVR